GARGEGLMELAGRGDLEATALRQEELEQRAVRIGLDRVTDVEPGWQRPAQAPELLLDHTPAVEERGRPVARGEPAHRHAVDHELALPGGKSAPGQGPDRSPELSPVRRVATPGRSPCAAGP